MKKLKILKDLQKDYEWRYDTYQALRQAAREWIKEKDSFLINQELIKICETDLFSEDSYAYKGICWKCKRKVGKDNLNKFSALCETCLIKTVQDDWIKHFFNLEKEIFGMEIKEDKTFDNIIWIPTEKEKKEVAKVCNKCIDVLKGLFEIPKSFCFGYVG